MVKALVLYHSQEFGNTAKEEGYREGAAGKEEAQYKRFGCLKRDIAVYCQEGNTNNRITQE